MNETEAAQVYDVIVIGAGPTGENVADRAQRGGLSAVIVERELVGGECSYWACMPSKALLRPVAAVADARAVAGAAEAVTGQLDVRAVLARRDGFASHWDDGGQVKWLDGVGVALVRGQGRLVGPKRVAVEQGDGSRVELEARHAVVVATGSGALVPDLPGLREAKPWTSREATSAQEAPGHLAILGGGVVATEMATAWSALGSKVTLLERSPRLLGGLEPFASEAVADGLRSRGVDVRLGVSVEAVQRPEPGGPVTLQASDGSRVEADEVLVAAGRTPATDDIGLETVGLTPGSWLKVDDSCRVEGIEGGWLYAAGDVNHRALLTHMGKYQARVCGDVIAARAKAAAGGSDQGSTPSAGTPGAPASWGPWAASADHEAVPQVVFTHPEVGAVGLSEQAARDAGYRVRAVEYEIGHVAGASLFADGYQGHAKMVVDEDRRVVLGLTMTGAGVGELVHAATIAIVGQVPLDRLWHAVPSYPTVSEIWLRLLETYGL